MKTYTLNEIEELVIAGNPKYICLENSAGLRVIPFNTKKDLHSKEHFKKIMSYLNNPNLCPDGFYYFITGNSLANDAMRIKYTIKKGNFDETKIETQPAMKEESKADKKEIYSYEKLLTLHQELAEYKSKCAIYESEISNLKEQVEDLEDEIAQYESKADNSGGLGEAGTMLAAKAMQILEQMVTPSAQPIAEPSPQPPPVSEPQKITYQNLFEMLKNNPALIDRLAHDLNISYQQSEQENEQANGTNN